MKALKISTFILMLVLMASCKSNTPGSENQSSDDASVTTTEPVQANKYSIKSGIIEYTTKMMGMDVNQVIYFDDYGKKQATETTMEMMGVKSQNVSITREGYLYMYDANAKTGTKKPIIGLNGTDIDFNNLSADMEKKMNLKKEGKEEFAGKTCEKYSIDYADVKMKGTFLVWQGIALKTDVDMGSIKMEMSAKSIQENVAVPAEKFEVPADIKLTEM